MEPINNSTDSTNQPLQESGNSSPISDDLKGAKTTSTKKSGTGKIVGVLLAVLFLSYIAITLVVNFTKINIPAVSKLVYHFHAKTSASDTTKVTEATTADAALALDTTVTAKDTMSKDALATIDTSKKTVAEAKSAKEEKKPKEEKELTVAKPSISKTEPVKPLSKTTPKEPATEKSVVEKPVAPKPVAAKTEKNNSSSTAIPKEEKKLAVVSENKTKEKTTETLSKTEKKSESVTKSKFVKKVDDYAVYHSDNSYMVPAGQISSSSAYPTYNYKVNPNEKSASYHSTSSSYVSYNVSEARFIKASKPYPTSLDGYLKAIGNPEIDYDTRFAFSERCLQTYFIPGATAQQIDENGKTMNTISMEDLFGLMRVNEFNVNIKDRQASGNRIASIKFNYKF